MTSLGKLTSRASKEDVLSLLDAVEDLLLRLGELHRGREVPRWQRRWRSDGLRNGGLELRRCSSSSMLARLPDEGWVYGQTNFLCAIPESRIRAMKSSASFLV